MRRYVCAGVMCFWALNAPLFSAEKVLERDFLNSHWNRLEYRYSRTHNIEKMPIERSRKVGKDFTYYEGAQLGAALKQRDYQKKYERSFGPKEWADNPPPHYRWAKQEEDTYRHQQYDSNVNPMPPGSNVYAHPDQAEKVRKNAPKTMFYRVFGPKSGESKRTENKTSLEEIKPKEGPVERQKSPSWVSLFDNRKQKNQFLEDRRKPLWG